MKKRAGITVLLILSAILAVSLSACGESVPDNILVSDISVKIDEAIGNSGDLREVDGSYIKNTIKIDDTEYEDFIVKINAIGINIDEYGIFKGSDKTQTEAIVKSIESYLKLRNDTWMTEYMPEERPKMQDASVKTKGNYVIYAILESNSKKAAFDAFENTLK